MNTTVRVMLRLALTVCTVAAAHAAFAQEKRISAADAWVSLPAAGASETAAFMNLENPTMYDVYVQSAKTDVANKVELRDAGSDTPRKPLEFITVPNHDSVYMGPKGIHIVLIDLKRPLAAGETIALTLTTELGDTMQVAALVKKP